MLGLWVWGKNDRSIVEKTVLTHCQICCLSEIPIQHLPYHAKRYGRFAIGFHRESCLQKGFRPVLYALEDDWIAENLEKTRGFILKYHPKTTFTTPVSEDHPSDTIEHKRKKREVKSFLESVNRHDRSIDLSEEDERSTLDVALGAVYNSCLLSGVQISQTQIASWLMNGLNRWPVVAADMSKRLNLSPKV